MARKEKGAYTPAPRDWTLPERAKAYYKEIVAIYGTGVSISQIAEYIGYSYDYVRKAIHDVKPIGGTHNYRAMDIAAWLVDRELAAERHERAKKAVRA